MMNDKAVIERMNALSMPDIKKQREGILELEKELLGMEQAEMPPTHLVHGGMYARAVTVPPGCLLTGAIYKFDHIEIMVKGTLAVTTDDGSARVLEGFNLMPALTGKKRAAYAIEETTWLTVHSVGDTGGLTAEEIQQGLTSETFDDLDQFYADVNRVDYQHFITSHGVSEEQMQELVTDESDRVDLDLEQFGLYLDDSNIHGVGMFSGVSVDSGNFLMPARLKDKRTQAGRYINHAVRPNCKFIFDGTDLNVVAIKKLYAGDEITVNYRDTLDVRKAGGDL